MALYGRTDGKVASLTITDQHTYFIRRPPNMFQQIVNILRPELSTLTQQIIKYAHYTDYSGIGTYYFMLLWLLPI